ncbi:MAG: hypothetical protein A3A57_00380 [Candidatus Woykebacteria bacterium RIFCSPLOWO2_01_FULL_41_12]|uniref:Uncharacterized protein n=1 Tax=Candidatus Woykebacteria bacterium RIFCSPLOWO2_01_FULL_41_12 TaxID=1802604 RepID=A0A1G1WS11_9BACT|nr:MAG: hypothetical protein A3A57_00380 [Candidatus Woykebacteria bacterium RIFCSPLOWO2_01_FULL_41_12]
MGTESQLDPKTNEAINAALESNWEKALELNKLLLEKYPNDIGAMNRFARALSETGALVEAKKIYKKILEIDPYNQIAEKNLHRISSLKKGYVVTNKSVTSLKGDFFLEEPGKTIVLPLEDTAMPQILADLQIGDGVDLVPHKNEVTVNSGSGKRIGKVRSGLAKSLAQHIRAGSNFESFIKSISLVSKKEVKEKSQVLVFIRETNRSPKMDSNPFPVSSDSFTPFVREEAFMKSNQAPVLAESDEGVEEVEVNSLSTFGHNEESLEELAEKEQQESDEIEQE